MKIVICPKCHTSFHGTICPFCGHKYQRKNKFPLPVIIAICAVLIIALLLLVLL